MTSLEALMGERLGQACLHVPSARFGLLLALRHWFRPGDRVLIAPTNCETVLFAALAAGLTPVMAPVSARDGNIDAGRVDWTGLAGVLSLRAAARCVTETSCHDHSQSVSPGRSEAPSRLSR